MSDDALRTHREACSSEEYIREFCADARDLVIGCTIHVCSPSCFKYQSDGAHHICRHGFYHIVTVIDEDWNEIRRRRKGGHFRKVMSIFRDTHFGMLGRIITYQDHGFELSTNYCGPVAFRNNLDVQVVRRVLSPHLWMHEEDLNPYAKESESDNYNHGAYSQGTVRALWTTGDWGWFQHLGITQARGKREIVALTDWHTVFAELVTTSPTTKVHTFEQREMFFKSEDCSLARCYRRFCGRTQRVHHKVQSQQGRCYAEVG